MLSIDDLYLTHDDQVSLAQNNPSNKLVQYRGEPGTHDMTLAAQVFDDLEHGKPTSIPVYDKSRFSGQGDRTEPELWVRVNEPSTAKVKVVLFEGWCVGFRALEDDQVESKWRTSIEQHKITPNAASTLWQHELSHLKFVNSRLRAYSTITDRFNAFIHIDAQDTVFVYAWRHQQEREMILAKGSGMSEEQVKRFVDGYYPAYELYTENLRKGVFKEGKSKGRQLRLIVSSHRKVVESVEF